MKKYFKFLIGALIISLIVSSIFMFSKDEVIAINQKQEIKTTVKKKKEDKSYIPFISKEALKNASIEKMKNKTYITNLKISEEEKIDELIIEKNNYKILGANINLDSKNFLKQIKQINFSKLDAMNSFFTLKNNITNLTFSGQFFANNDKNGLQITSNNMNIKSDFFDLTSNLVIINNEINIEITRGFFSNKIASSFNITGNLSIKDGNITGKLKSPTANIKDIEFKNLVANIDQNKRWLNINAKSENLLNRFKTDLSLNMDSENSLHDIKLKIDVSGKENISADIKGFAPLSLNSTEIIEKSSLKGSINAKIKNITLSPLIKDATVNFNGYGELSKERIVFKTKNKLELWDSIDDHLAKYIPDNFISVYNHITLTPLKDKELFIEIKPNLNIENANIEIDNSNAKTIGDFLTFSLKENILNASFKNIKTPKLTDEFSIKSISGNIEGDINKELSGNASVNYDYTGAKFSITDATKEIKYTLSNKNNFSEELVSFKAKNMEMNSPKIYLKNVLLDNDNNFSSSKVYSKYSFFAPFSIKGKVNKDNQISGYLKNDNINFKITGENKSKSLNIKLNSKAFDFNDKNIPKLKGLINRFVSGTITPSANIKINKITKDFNTSSLIKLNDITFDDERYAVSSLNYDFKLDSLFPLEMDEQTIRSSFLLFKGVELFSNKIRFSIKDGILNLKAAKAKFGTGDVDITPSSQNLDGERLNFILNMKDCKLQSIFDLAKLQHLKSTGKASGKISFNYQSKNMSYSIPSGGLFSTEGGHFSYKNIPKGEVLIPDFNVKMTKGALANFFFDSLQFTITKKYNKNAEVKTLIKGYSPDFWGGKNSSLNLDLSPVFERVFK